MTIQARCNVCTLKIMQMVLGINITNNHKYYTVGVFKSMNLRSKNMVYSGYKMTAVSGILFVLIVT